MWQCLLNLTIVTFKKCDVKMKNFNIMGVHWKIQFSGIEGRGLRKQYIGGELP